MTFTEKLLGGLFRLAVIVITLKGMYRDGELLRIELKSALKNSIPLSHQFIANTLRVLAWIAIGAAAFGFDVLLGINVMATIFVLIGAAIVLWDRYCKSSTHGPPSLQPRPPSLKARDTFHDA